MTHLFLLTVVPVLILILIWSCKPTQIMTGIAGCLFWVQLILVAYVLYPVLAGGTASLDLAEQLSVNRLGAYFALLTQLVVATSMTHAHLFFMLDGAHAVDKGNQLRLFYTCVTLFLLTMTAVFFCNNLGFLWISVEGTTLCSAPLVYFQRTKHSLEAAWKYLMICSVGIAFALFGTILIFASSQYGATPKGSLDLRILQAHAPLLQYPLLRLGFLFCLLGYGTKAGVFPLHSWLPDAHSEAPAPASAMLSGGLLNCALFAVWRVVELLLASGHQAFVQHATIPIGVLTVLVASIFLIRQHGIKRLFAYLSIENVGLMLTAIGFGSGPLFFFLALNHSAAKVALFLLSGNIIQAMGTKSLNDIHGLLSVSPVWSIIFLMGALAVTGAPPFGAFAAEWMLLASGAEHHEWSVIAILLVALALSFISLTMHVGKMLSGSPKGTTAVLPVFNSSVIPALLVVLTFLCGLTAVPQLFW